MRSVWLLVGLLQAGVAQAASLDNLEMGGPWGTPAATDATAVWWSPAGLAMGHGTRVLIEGAPTFAVINVDRSDPHGGPDQIRLQGAVPFAGVATDLGLHGLGVGVGVGAPYVRGGTETPDLGPVRYQLRDGSIQTAAIMMGAGYAWKDKVAVGAGLHVLHNTWSALLDKDNLPDLADQINAMGQDPGYTDADLENADYGAALDFQGLSDWAVSWSAGLQLRPLEPVTVSLTWIQGFHVDNTGPVDIAFGCPPQSDTLGRFGAESFGICDSAVHANAVVGYDLPSRLHGGIQVKPTPELSLEAMGGVVFWSAFQDYAISIQAVAANNPELPEDTLPLVQRDQAWARDNHDTFWAGLDAKGTLADRFTLGGRMIYDATAIPSSALSANNYDANTVIMGGMLAVRVVKQVQLGASWSHYFLASRTVTDSAFSMSLDPALRPETRYDYPQSNGSYSGRVDRLGITARVLLGGFGEAQDGK